MSEIGKGQWLCSLAMVLVGSTVVVSQIIGADMEPFLATVLRHALALPVFVALMLWRGERLPRFGRRDALWLTLQAAAGSVGYSVLLIFGVMLSSAADAGVLAGTLPAAAALLCVALLGERAGVRLVLSIALATAGAMAIAFAPDAGGHAPTRLLGILLVLAAVLCEAVFVLAHKRLSQPIAALPLSMLMSAGGVVLAALPAWWFAQHTPHFAANFTPQAMLGVLYYAWLPTVGGFLLWYAGSARTTGLRASLATACMPVSALLLSALVLGESIGAFQWLGLACVLLAMVLAAFSRGGAART
ncbi:MAG: DMT family transporter [Giesbergeria sp.]